MRRGQNATKQTFLRGGTIRTSEIPKLAESWVVHWSKRIGFNGRGWCACVWPDPRL